LYSPEIEAVLKAKGIRVGDRIRITKGRVAYEGILMPRIELGDAHALVLKLDNGYNIGIRFEKGVRIRRLMGGRKIGFRAAGVKSVRDPKKPTVSILGCGGTIAARVEYTTGAVYPAFSPGDLLLSFPQLKDVANIRGRKLFDLLSEDMTPKHWQVIAKEAAKDIKNKVDGVVLMHGTDTMHYTAAALSFMLQTPVPVVLVGAQRSSDRGSSDNAMNLLCSTIIAAKSDIAHVTVCMHANMSDSYCYVHSGVRVRKLHTSRRDAFRSVNALPFAKVWPKSGKIEYLRDDFNRRNRTRLKLDNKVNPNVALVYVHPGIKPELIDSLRSYDGVVIAATGLGHVPTNPFDDAYTKSIVPNLKSLIDSGIAVVIAPQTLYGRLNMNVYTAGRRLKAIGVIGDGCDWLPEVALVKLMWVLGHTKSLERVRRMMLKNIAGEISERTEAETFLM